MVVFRRHAARRERCLAPALLWACAMTTAPEPDEAVEPRRAQERRSDGWGRRAARSRRAWTKQTIPARRRTLGPAHVATDIMPPSEQPIWIRTGKSRILRFNRPVQRVSIGNPEIAGVVVARPADRHGQREAAAQAEGRPGRRRDPSAAARHRLEQALHGRAYFRPRPRSPCGRTARPARGAHRLRRRLHEPAGDARGDGRRDQPHRDGGARHRLPADRDEVSSPPTSSAAAARAALGSTPFRRRSASRSCRSASEPRRRNYVFQLPQSDITGVHQGAADARGWRPSWRSRRSSP